MRPLPAAGYTLAPVPAHNLDDYDIVRVYAAEYRGVINYYLLARDVWRLHRLRWNAETSMLKTLAAKHKSTVTKMAARHKAKIETPHGLRTCFEARIRREGKEDLVARFGGISLLRDKNKVITDPAPVLVPAPRKELVHRLLARRCELCGHGATVAVHQVAKLARLGNPDPASPRGQPRWPGCGARPWWSAAPATRSSTQPLSRTRRSRWRARCGESRPAGVHSEVRLRGKGRGSPQANRGPRRAAHPVHESTRTTMIYLKADLELKQRALDRTVPVDGQPGRYRPPDDIIDFLDRL